MVNLRPRLPLLLALGLLLLAPVAFAQTVVEEIGADGAPGQDGEAAHAAGVEIRPGAEPVELEVRARGGNGGPATPAGDPAGAGGDASLGAVYGKSETGEVRVVGEAWAGRGGTGEDGAAAGDGSQAHLRNAVDGDSAGPLRLEQRALGGSAGAGIGGVGGAASSHLSRAKSAESLEVHSQANGGGRAIFFDDDDGFVSSDFGGPGAPAAASGRAGNDAGPATVFSVAVGGAGGIREVGGPAAPGGDAQAWATGSTRGDGHPVQVGHPFPEPDVTRAQPIFAAAVGGPGGAFRVPRGAVGVTRTIRGALGGGDRGGYTPQEVRERLEELGVEVDSSVKAPGGDGGAASSFSMGMARGRSPVEVYDVAIGGTGGSQVATFATREDLPSTESYIDVGAGVGGAAHSVAIGLGGRGEPIGALANARGGDASDIVELLQGRLVPAPGGPSNMFGRRSFPALGDFGASGGPAHAKAQAVGSGPVTAEARAEGGGGSAWLGTGRRNRHVGGPAHAEASGTGRGGSASARAGSNSPTTSVKVGAASEVLHSARVEAKIGANALDPPRRRGRRGWRRFFQRADATARAVVDPKPALVDAALEKAPRADVGPGEPGDGTFHPAIGRWTARQRQWSWRESLTTTLTLELRTERNLFDDPTELYLVALLSPKLSRWGFEELRVRLEKEGRVLEEEVFSDAAEAQVYLDGQVLAVGTIGFVEIPFPSPAAAALVDATITIAGGGGEVQEGPGGVIVAEPVDFPVPVFGFRRSEVAVLTIELDTRRPGAGLELDFLVSATPIPR